jgi:prevent-host-death family protein
MTNNYVHGIINWSKLNMEEIAISEFKAKCLALLERVRQTKQPLRVTRFGKPVAEIVPPSPETGQNDWIGSMKDTMKVLGDIVSPVINEQDMEALRD